MSNPMRGEADLGDRKLIVNFNSLCVAEAAMGVKVPDMVDMLDGGMGFDDLRRLLKSILVGGEKMTLDEVGDLIGTVGLDAVGEAIGKAFMGFFPAAEKDDAARPLKAE